jgi:hypothetical protein
MKRIGFFKRIGNPVSIGKLHVKTGDVIKADFDFIMEQKEGGWLYIKQPTPVKPQPLQNTRERRVMHPAPRPEGLPILSTPSKPVTVEEQNAVRDVTNFYENVERVRLEELEKANPPPPPIEVNIDKLKEMKKLSNKEWMSVTKDQSIKLLKEANIDFSHVASNRWELVKFIKGIIKDL